MSIEENVQIVKDFFKAMGSGDKDRLLALSGKDIEWIVPATDWRSRTLGIGGSASEGARNRYLVSIAPGSAKQIGNHVKVNGSGLYQRPSPLS
jgi:ketosteroid isomerase-like protein